MTTHRKSPNCPRRVRCENCKSHDISRIDSTGEFVCEDCGMVHSIDLKADSNEVISHNTKAKRLGSEISRKSASRGIRRAIKTTRKRPSYLERLKAMVEDVVPAGRIRDSVKDLLEDYNDQDSELWRKRRKLHGGKDAIYRMRVLVSGALSALFSEMEHNEANTIAREWNIQHKDLLYSRTMFRRFLLRECRTPNIEDLRKQRKRELLFHLERYRDFLAERVGWEVASHIFEAALEELGSNFEPVLDDEESQARGATIQSTKYGTRSSEYASWSSVLVAILDYGMSSEIIRWLEKRAAPSSGGNIARDFSRRANARTAALSDGFEEE